MKSFKRKGLLISYDILFFAMIELLLLLAFRNVSALSPVGVISHILLSFACIFGTRFVCKIYQQIWRYGGIQCYLRLLMADGIAFLVNVAIESVLSHFKLIEPISFVHLLSICSLFLLISLFIRMLYRYVYKCGNNNAFRFRLLNLGFRLVTGESVSPVINDNGKIRIAIIGAGRIGVSLAEELLANKSSSYIPVCFVDRNEEKVNRAIHDIPVFLENSDVLEVLSDLKVQEVVFALPPMDESDTKSLSIFYLNAGYKIKIYDVPAFQSVGKKMQLREFDIEDLLFRKTIKMSDEKTTAYYKDKIILITGGGGSIGSELCRQLAKMRPKQIIILDIYENGAYDVQQELRIAYNNEIDVKIEICSITNKKALERVFETYHPQIIINAAAHKHVPLMEHNCIEAVENNVFGCKNLVDVCEAYGAERFMMVSTDKAVNPTNVMGATKRMCEMIVSSASTYGNVKYSSTRFGNVLGSAGSVIPLFKKQIANGGPITLTDKRIIRYFMTIPEASQLVLQSGALAQNGELFVLDMGQPVKIYELAENMIRLSGAHHIDIVEVGLRPGEKLYEELLIKTENLDKTSNSLIFIEKDNPLDQESVDSKLKKLKDACLTGDDDYVRQILKDVVPTYKAPEDVNVDIKTSEDAKKFATV